MQGAANNFHLLRLILSILVLYSHSKIVVEGNRPFFDLQSLTHEQTYLGDVAVNGFFAISGYLITMSWERAPQLSTYLQRRIARIYPGYLVAMLFTILAVGCLGADSVTRYFHSIPWVKLAVAAVTLGRIPNLETFLSNPLPGEMNGSLWSIRIEFECYLLVIALSLARSFKRPIVLICLAVTTILVGLATFNSALNPSFMVMERQYLSVRSLAYFLVGMGLYLYQSRVRFTRVGVLLSLGALALTAVFGGLEVVSLFTLPYLLFFLAFHRVVNLPHWLRLNDLSYGIYLYGWPVQQLITRLLGPQLNPYALFALSLLATVGLAALSWKFIESPWLARRTNR